MRDLALFGGPPAFTEKVHVGRPNIGNRERLLKRINEMLDRNWLTNDGPYVQQFEKQIAEFVGVRHCVAMCNGTVALEIAIRALGLSGEVIVPSFTFVATAHALQWQEITPVFCDIEARTHRMDPAQVEKMITPLTSGIIGVGPRVRCGGAGSDCAAAEPAAVVRCGARVCLLVQGEADRRFRALRDIQFPRHKVF
jgi:DegT/DnrJ/EryC1/StrS aminotransferase family